MNDIIFNKNNFFENSTASFIKIDDISILDKLGEPDYVSYKKKWINTILYQQYNDVDVFPKEKFNVIGYGETDENMVQVLTNEVSSKYWYTENGVYRLSDHWNFVASCWWAVLDISESIKNIELVYIEDFSDNNNILGYCNFSDFDKHHED